MSNKLSGGRIFKTRGPLDPIADAAIYVERPECSQLVALARSLTVNNYTALLGSRQSGKTSLLYKARQTLLDSSDISVAYVDLQGLGTEDESTAYSYVSDQMIREWQCDPSFDPSALPKVSNGPTFRQFLLQAAKCQRTTRLVIMVDEVGAFPSRFADGFFGTIRNAFTNRLKSNEEVFSKYLFIFSGAVDLQTLTSGANSPLNICDKLYLADLTPAGVRQLTDLLATRQRFVPDTVSDYLYTQTHGHPYLTQRICSILEERANGAITYASIDQAVAELLRGDDNLDHVTRLLDQDKEAQDVARRIVVDDEQIQFSRVNPVVGRLETIGAIRPDGRFGTVRNEVYLHALRMYFGEAPEGPAPWLKWLKHLWLPLGLLLILLFSPSAVVYLIDVYLAPPAVQHVVDLKAEAMSVIVKHQTVLRDSDEATISLEMKRMVPLSALTVTISTADPEINLRDRTRFVVLHNEDERKEFKLQLLRLHYFPNLFKPLENRRYVSLKFTTPDGSTSESVEEFHSDFLKPFDFLGTLIAALIGLGVTVGRILASLETVKMLPKRINTFLQG